MSFVGGSAAQITNIGIRAREWSGWSLSTYLAPKWFNTSLFAPMALANAPAIPGVECPRSMARCLTLSSVSFLPGPCGSISGGIYALVASCTSKLGSRDKSFIAHGSQVSPSRTSFLPGTESGGGVRIIPSGSVMGSLVRRSCPRSDRGCRIPCMASASALRSRGSMCIDWSSGPAVGASSKT